MALTRTKPELIIAQATHEGMSGKQNEDNLGSFCWQVNGRRLLHVGVVADGIGGQIAGELASRLAVEAVAAYFDNLDGFEGNVTDHLARAVSAANTAVYERGQANPELQGMGTTMVIVGVLDGRLYTAYVGDSRIYLLRDGRLRQLTVDHTWAQEAIEAGLLTREQAKTHPNRNVIKQFLGGFPEVEADRRLAMEMTQSRAEMLTGQGMRLRAGDTVLLCSDGLSDMINDDAIHQSLYDHYEDLDTAANELVDKANQAGGKDNITLVIIQTPGGKRIAPAAALGTTASAARTGTRQAATPAAAPAAPAASAAAATHWSLPLMLLGGGLLGLLLLLGVGMAVMISINNGRQNNETAVTDTPPATPWEDQSAPTNAAPEDPAATAAILAPTAASTETNSPDEEPESGNGSLTPAASPTLQPTPTNTPVPPTRTPAPTPTPTATATPTATSEPAAPPPPPPGGDLPSPQATDTPQPTFTPTIPEP
jgi:PPM family protein phosphatase